MGMYGADADQLDSLSALLDDKANELEAIYRRLGRQLHTAPWQGQGADRFRGRWNTVHSRQVTDAAVFLRSGAKVLRDNARQQRAASGNGTGALHAVPVPPGFAGGGAGGGGGGGWGGPSFDGIKAVLDKLGIPADALDRIKHLLERLDPVALAKFEKFLTHHAGLVSFIEDVGKYAGIAAVAVGFVQDVVDHSDLPMDEALVHAAIKSGAAEIEDIGAEKVGEFLGGAIGSIIPVGGTAAGVAIGFVVGKVVDMGVDALEDHFHMTDRIADTGLEAYQYLKTHDIGDMVLDGAEHVVDGAIDGAENLAKGAWHGIENAASGVEDAGKSAWNFVFGD